MHGGRTPAFGPGVVIPLVTPGMHRGRAHQAYCPLLHKPKVYFLHFGWVVAKSVIQV